MKRNTKNPGQRKIISTALICIVCILVHCFLLQGITTLNNKQYISSRLNLDFLKSSSIPRVIQWNTTWGGSGDDSGYDIAVDSFDNIYLAGRTTSFGEGNDDMVLVKYNSLGEQQWNITWDGNNDERAFVALDSSDNIILVGYTNSFGAGNQDIVLVKYNSLGEQQWNTTWGGSNDEFSSSIVLDSSDNIILAGHTNNTGDGNSDIVLVKYNNLGEHQWNTTWGGSSGEGAYSIALDTSENIYITGYTKSFGAGLNDLVLIKYNNSGEQQWNTTWGGSAIDYGSGFALDSLENIYITGYTMSFGSGPSDIALVKYNNLGEKQWNTTWGGSSSEGTWDGIGLDSLENIFLAGHTRSFGAGVFDIVLVKLNSLGEQQWNTTWGGSGDDYGEAIAFDSSENIYITGYTRSFGAGNDDIVLIKYQKSSPENGSDLPPNGIPGYPLMFLCLFGLISTFIILYRKILKINTIN